MTCCRPLARVTAIVRPVHALSPLSAQPMTLTRNCVSLPNQSALLPRCYSQPWSCEQVNSELQRSELWSTPGFHQWPRPFSHWWLPFWASDEDETDNEQLPSWQLCVPASCILKQSPRRNRNSHSERDNCTN